MEHFTIDLLSNSSMEIFKNNKTSNFTVHLPKKIVLHGNWEVCLTEINIPNNFHNVTQNNNRIFYEEYENNTLKKYCWHIMKHSYYSNIESIVNEINDVFESKIKVRLLHYQAGTDKILVNMAKYEEYKLYDKIYFENKLATQLGFLPNENILIYNVSPNFASVHHHGTFDYVFVYCDIVEPKLFSNTFAQILKVFPREKKSDDQTILSKEFHNLEYLKLIKREFDTIEINLRTTTGEFMPFIHGIANLKLHFKKIK